MKSFTDIEQSKKLAKILQFKSADMSYIAIIEDYTHPKKVKEYKLTVKDECFNPRYDIPAWSLSALMELMNRNCYNVSLNCHGAEWNIKLDDSEKYKSFTKDYAVDAAFEMVCWLLENDKWFADY